VSTFAEAVAGIRVALGDQLLADRGRAVDLLLEAWATTEGDVRAGLERLIGSYQHVSLVEIGDLLAQLDLLVDLSSDSAFLDLDPIG
jgi:hypothetical protein